MPNVSNSRVNVYARLDQKRRAMQERNTLLHSLVSSLPPKEESLDNGQFKH